MKELHDEAIQKLLEQHFSLNGLPEEIKASDENEGDDFKKDLQIYHQLFHALKQEPKEGLPYDFSSKLRFKLQVELNRKNAVRFYVKLAFIFILGLAGMMAMLALWDYSYGTGLLTAMKNFKGFFIFSFVCLFLIQYLDHKFLKSA